MTYTFLRHIEWILEKDKFAKEINKSSFLPATVFSHSSPLIRDLQGLDIRLQRNKIKNLSLSIGRLNGLLLKPGETFSFWRLVGRPARKRGYLNGLVLNSGGLSEGVGGGLCQLTNLIYWMSLHAPLEITERYRHSYDVFPDSNRTQPFGSGATCVYNYRDLMIKNSTDRMFQLKLYMDGENLYGAWLCESPAKIRYEVYENKHWITLEYWGGYTRHNEIRRRTYDASGSLLADEKITENNALMMYQPFLSQQGEKQTENTQILKNSKQSKK